MKAQASKQTGRKKPAYQFPRDVSSPCGRASEVPKFVNYDTQSTSPSGLVSGDIFFMGHLTAHEFTQGPVPLNRQQRAGNEPVEYEKVRTAEYPNLWSPILHGAAHQSYEEVANAMSSGIAPGSWPHAYTGNAQDSKAGVLMEQLMPALPVSASTLLARCIWGQARWQQSPRAIEWLIAAANGGAGLSSHHLIVPVVEHRLDLSRITTACRDRLNGLSQMDEALKTVLMHRWADEASAHQKLGQQTLPPMESMKKAATATLKACFPTEESRTGMCAIRIDGDEKRMLEDAFAIAAKKARLTEDHATGRCEDGRANTCYGCLDGGRLKPCEGLEGCPNVFHEECYQYASSIRGPNNGPVCRDCASQMPRTRQPRWPPCTLVSTVETAAAVTTTALSPGVESTLAGDAGTVATMCAPSPAVQATSADETSATERRSRRCGDQTTGTAEPITNPEHVITSITSSIPMPATPREVLCAITDESVNFGCSPPSKKMITSGVNAYQRKGGPDSIKYRTLEREWFVVAPPSAGDWAQTHHNTKCFRIFHLVTRLTVFRALLEGKPYLCCPFRAGSTRNLCFLTRDGMKLRRKVALEMLPRVGSFMKLPSRSSKDGADFTLMRGLYDAGFLQCPSSGMPVFDPDKASKKAKKALWDVYSEIARLFNSTGFSGIHKLKQCQDNLNKLLVQELGSASVEG
jgi:hypothetical protein